MDVRARLNGKTSQAHLNQSDLKYRAVVDSTSTWKKIFLQEESFLAKRKFGHLQGNTEI